MFRCTWRNADVTSVLLEQVWLLQLSGGGGGGVGGGGGWVPTIKSHKD